MSGRALLAGAVDVWVCLNPAARPEGVVEHVLDRYTLISAAAGSYAHDARGRPIVPGCNEVCISVSHTTDAVLVALGRQCRIGVDIEPVRDRGLSRVQHHVLAAPELDELNKLERQEPIRRTETFLGYWTRKEALLKAAGVGLAVEPRLIELPPARCSPHPVAVPERLGRARDWWIAELDVAGYAAAVAVDLPAPRVQVLSLPQLVAARL